MKETDYPLLGHHYGKSDRRQGQANRAARDGNFILPRLIEEFGYEQFSKQDFRDAFHAYVPTGRNPESRKINLMAGLASLVNDEYVEKDGNHYIVTDRGRAFADQMAESDISE